MIAPRSRCHRSGSLSRSMQTGRDKKASSLQLATAISLSSASMARQECWATKYIHVYPSASELGTVFLENVLTFNKHAILNTVHSELHLKYLPRTKPHRWSKLRKGELKTGPWEGLSNNCKSRHRTTESFWKERHTRSSRFSPVFPLEATIQGHSCCTTATQGTKEHRVTSVWCT